MNQAMLLAQSDVRTYFSFEPLFPLTSWMWGVVFLLSLAWLVFVVVMYLYDSVELSAGTTATLMVLRAAALLGMLVFLLNPGIRSEKRITKNSRVPILVDTSLSMGLRDAGATSVPAPASRIEKVVRELADGKLIQQFRKQHDVVVYRFDQESKPLAVASFPRMTEASDEDGEMLASIQGSAASLGTSRSILTLAGVLIFLTMVSGAGLLMAHLNSPTPALPAWLLFTTMVLLVISVVVFSAADLWSPDVRLMAILGLASPEAEVEKPEESDSDNESEAPLLVADELKTELLPRGTETRLGEAMRYLVNKERGGPVAGIVVFTDGRNNAGIEHTAAVYAARDAQIPIYTVGMGSSKRPANVRVVDLEAPRRVFPGDKFTVKGLIQSYGLAGRRVRVELVSTREDNEQLDPRFEAERTVILGEDGKEIPEQFEVSPEEDEGRRIYKLRVKPPEQDLDARDNEKTATVEVVERKNKVLLMAGGPTREYRFLRNQLFRDESTTLHVLLQTGQPGIAQESDELLFEFPDEADTLFDYDCLIAFDPDWRVLKEEQVELLERWIAEKAGGMIVVAGPVYTPQWTRRPPGDTKMNTMRTLYPVSFFNQGSATIKLGRFGGEEPWPLAFSREGRSAEFLWPEDTAEKSLDAWRDFAGVYGYYAVNEPKPGATVFARFSDPSTSGGPNDELPIYLAGQFYGAGRVFFQASGEMWRIRAVDDQYFEQYYTKLIRWVSQGRLLRDSSRGVLLLDKDRCLLGDQIDVRAILTDAQHLPLLDEEIQARLIQPDSTSVELTLRSLKDGTREGTFAGQFTALQEGDYRVVVAVPDSNVGELLTRELGVRIPDLEIERPQRHDVLLSEVSEKTHGVYFVGLDDALNRGGSGVSLASVVEPQDQITYLPGTPNQNFTTKLMGWLLAFICGVLCLEWIIRRLSKLA